MDLARTGEPAAEPVTLAEVKAHLRVLHASEDTLITRLARAARVHIETVTSRAFITQSWKLWLDAFPASGVIELPRPPLVGVSAIRYVDADGATQTLATSVYHVVTQGFQGRIERKASQSWPATDEHPQAVEIEFVAGYGGDSTAVPEDLRNAILLQAEHFYFNRGATTETRLEMNPMGVDALIGPYRTHGWL